MNIFVMYNTFKVTPGVMNRQRERTERSNIASHARLTNEKTSNNMTGRAVQLVV